MRNEGPSGLYKGLPAQLLKTVLVAALMQMARHGGTHLHRRRLTWHAVVSGLSASCPQVKEKSFGAAFVAVAVIRSRSLTAGPAKKKEL